MSYRSIAANVPSLAATLLLVGCINVKGTEQTSVTRSDKGLETVQALDLRQVHNLATILDDIQSDRVVFVGETHDSYADHLGQLAVVQGLAERWPDMAIGLEMFQRPFQNALDDYVAGRIDEAQMLKRTEYFRRWRFDYRYYRPILRLARERSIPLVALNAPSELVRKLGREGVEGLDNEQRAALPRDLGTADDAYRARLKTIFDQHPRTESSDFDRFVEVQLLWDETMAETVADYLRRHPGRRMVILAGSGHVAHRSAIPDRLTRRLRLKSSILIGSSRGAGELGDADFLLVVDERELPPQPRIGIYMETSDTAVRIARVSQHSAAERSGLKAGDLITAVDGNPIEAPDDIKILLLDRRPGDRIHLDILRDATPSTKELVLDGG